MKFCSIEGCNEKHFCKGYCHKHYDQIKNHGKILKRNTFDLNEIIVEDQICRMKLYDKLGDEISETIFDLKYKVEIEKYKWSLHKSGYITCNWIDDEENKHTISLHQAIIRMSGQIVFDGYEIDHKDQNKLNNLEKNLRICTHQQNSQNKSKQKNNVSGYIGVSWYKQTRKWKATIQINYEQIFLGYFNTSKEAAKAYNEAALKYHGEFIKLNKIKEN